MNLKTSPFAIQDKKLRDLDLAKEYLTLKDLMKEQGVSTDLADYWDNECELNPSNPHCLESVSYTHLTLPTTPYV